jgi:penicillin-binding protein 1C
MTYVLHRHPQGGSTIAMQLARLLWGLKTRTPVGKLVQIARAVQLELLYSKRAILTAYLNYAPFGGNVVGVGAASLIYFHTSAAALTLPEALTLAMLPQDPARIDGDSANGTISPALLAARDRLFKRWLVRHPRDEAQSPLFALPMRRYRRANLPFEAPHLVDQILAQRAVQGDPPVSTITTTLDLDLQHVLERQVREYVAHNARNGIRNAAAILIDTRDMGVKALVGSADYFDRAIDGEVNGTLAWRSPGSTLKPFVYALGFEQGVLLPQTVLYDVPTAFGTYRPEDFDLRFMGPITAAEALNLSRNVPAVWVASKLHDPDLYHFLRSAGVPLDSADRHYGLTLALGGGEITMQELASLYAVLANGGLFQPLRFTAGGKPMAPRRLLSPQATFMVMNVLRHHVPPGYRTDAEVEPFPVYWKTGTSSGYRDAWTAGVFGPYVLIVWVGDFEDQGPTDFIGLESAAPLFFRIIGAIRAERVMSVPVRTVPPGLRRVRICLADGELPNRWCPARGWSWFIPGTSPIRVSTLYRPVVIDNATGLPACPPYAGRRTHVQVFQFWPSDVRRLYAAAGMPLRQPPQNPRCPRSGESLGRAPRITSPLLDSAYLMHVRRAPGRIAFTAIVDADVHRLYWFVGDDYVGHARAGKALLWRPAAPGRYAVRVVDDHGRSAERALRVTLQ